MSERKTSRYQKKNQFVDFFSNYLGGEILLTEKFSKWLPYIGFLFVLAILSITNEKVITSKERKIDNLKLEIEQLNREKAIEEANYFNRKDGKELTDKANKLGLKKNPSNIRGINKNEK